MFFKGSVEKASSWRWMKLQREGKWLRDSGIGMCQSREGREGRDQDKSLLSLGLLPTPWAGTAPPP